ncbi:MAG: D-alanyl-D-alanine carboxypeptidase [Acetobacteraceae bacterium]|nr:D-alanyl-D-alanine carboxypeptidase [Acetobacteraceae bacterium]
MAAKPLRRFVFLRWAPARAALLAILSIAALLAAPEAYAQVGSARYSSIVIDATTGEVLESANPDAPRHPASLTKMMTLFMAFEALRDRRITLDTLVPISAHAASQEPSKLGLVPGTRMTVDQAILGLVTKSANDAASALGELLGGSEDRFGQMMTLRARALGMSHTSLVNASGLPDPDQWASARDLAILARHLVNDFPVYYRYFSTPSFVWQRRVIFNHDRMLQSYPGADGLKTGYTDASGHNLVTSAVRGGVRLIGVVLGAGSNAERDIHMAALLNQGFGQMDVPVERRPTQTAGLIAAAHAATVETPKPAKLRVAAVASAWGIQVGSYPTERAARDAAATARRVADDGGELRIEAARVGRKTVWRAQIMGLTAADAQDACASLAHRKTPCAVLRPPSRQVASR